MSATDPGPSVPFPTPSSPSFSQLPADLLPPSSPTSTSPTRPREDDEYADYDSYRRFDNMGPNDIGSGTGTSNSNGNGIGNGNGEEGSETTPTPSRSPRPTKVPRMSETDTPAARSEDSDVAMAESEDGGEGEGNHAMSALEDELQCGMCSAVFINPVVLDGCGHVFCGSCVMLWIKSMPPYPTSLVPGDPVPNPVSCPHCRYSPIKQASPSRFARTMVDFLVAACPHAARSESERRQAEEVYSTANGKVITFPTPPPPPRPLNNSEFWRPCKSCYPTEEGAWRCPVPVPRFEVPAERALCLRTDGICPDGHRLCAACNRLSPNESPTSANCALCGEGFCGNKDARGCECMPLAQCRPGPCWESMHMAVEECSNDSLATAFRDNWVELGYLGDYLSQDRDSTEVEAETILRSIVTWLSSPESVQSGGLLGMMTRAESHLRIRHASTSGDVLAQPRFFDSGEEGETRPMALVCGGCVDDVMGAGLFEWWMREMNKPEVQAKLPEAMKNRTNCKHGRKCHKQELGNHAKKYNHICEPLPAAEADQIEQDDSLPTTTNGAAIPVEPATSSPPPEGDDDENDEDEDDEDDDDNEAENENTAGPEVVPSGRTFADVGVQYDEILGEGKIIYASKCVPSLGSGSEPLAYPQPGFSQANGTSTGYQPLPGSLLIQNINSTSAHSLRLPGASTSSSTPLLLPRPGSRTGSRPSSPLRASSPTAFLIRTNAISGGVGGNGSGSGGGSISGLGSAGYAPIPRPGSPLVRAGSPTVIRAAQTPPPQPLGMSMLLANIDTNAPGGSGDEAGSAGAGVMGANGHGHGHGHGHGTQSKGGPVAVVETIEVGSSTIQVGL